MPIYELADKKALPYFQEMDMDTVLWIEKNRPEFSGAKKLEFKGTDSVISFIYKSNLQKEWFEDARIYSGIHGMNHLLRVVINAFLLGVQFGLNQDSRMGLMVAALCHDIRRVNDKDDKGHGERSAQWLNDNRKAIFEMLGYSPSKEVFSNIMKSVTYHEVPYEYIPYEERNNDFVHLLKAADALDRYRLPKMKWWINDEHLVMKPRLDEKKFAFDMVVDTEKKVLKGKKPCEAVISYIERYVVQ